MCEGHTRDLAPRSQPQKTGSWIHLADSTELQGTEDQSPDPRLAPLANGLWDAPQRDRYQEDRGLGRRPWIQSVTDED